MNHQKDILEGLYQACFILLAVLISIFNVYGVLFIGPVYLVLAISYSRMKPELGRKKMNQWIVIPFVCAITIVLITAAIIA